MSRVEFVAGAETTAETDRREGEHREPVELEDA